MPILIFAVLLLAACLFTFGPLVVHRDDRRAPRS